MKIKLKKIIGVIILVVVAFLYAHIAKVHNIYNTEIDPSEYGNTGILTELGIKQEFVCAEEYLDGIRIKSTVTESAEQILLSYSLKNLSTGEVAASGKAEGKAVKNSKFFEIPFERIENCKDTRFELTVSSNVPAGTASGVGFAYEKNREEHTFLEVAGEEVENGTLILKTVTNRFDFETFYVFLVFALYVVLFMRFLCRLFK
ncbi:MAG: hypothetical protein UHO63_02670 [Blautia sp.]|nr:hypothetical protein [Blautia sp.]